jgi:hypothetical protein
VTIERGAIGQGDRAAAESLARVGKGLMDLAQYDDACPKLEQSLDAHPSGETALWLGECLHKQGKIASAWAAYRNAASHFQSAGDASAAVAGERAQRIESLVPKITIAAQQRVMTMKVYRGDTKFGVGVFGVPLAVDPGEHRIRVEAEGYAPWEKTVVVKASERITVEVPPLVPADVRHTTGGSNALYVAGILTAGSGVAAIGIGAILGIAAARDVSSAESDASLCGPSRLCTPEGRALVDAADTKAIGSTIAFTAGALAVATGLVLLIADGASDGGEVALWGVPAPDGGVANLRVTF